MSAVRSTDVEPTAVTGRKPFYLMPRREWSGIAPPHHPATLLETRPGIDPGEVLVVVSIDTEEDNWVPARDGLRAANIGRLPEFTQFMRAMGIKPTFFVTHFVATEPGASRVIRDLSATDGTEIGAHLHPWNTPPLTEAFAPRHTMLRNIPAALQAEKLGILTTALERCTGGRPTSFRAGRWGIGSDTISVLLDAGYRVDSSVTPFTSWESVDDGPSHVGAPTDVYRVDRGADIRQPAPAGSLLEIPPSFGFNRGPIGSWLGAYRFLSSMPVRALLLDRLLARFHWFRYVTLSPETDGVAGMMGLSRALLDGGAKYLHMYLHSPSLVPGLTPFVRSARDLERFRATMAEYFQQLAGHRRLRFVTVSEAARLLDPAPSSGQST
jgi:hypothetical protein